MKFIGSFDEYLFLITNDAENCKILNETNEDSLSIVWFTESIFNRLIIDGKEYTFNKNEIIFLTELHKVIVKNIKGIRLLRFNRPFFCIVGCDREVCCKGVLFFGSSQLPSIIIPQEELDRFETLWNMFTIEMQSNDNLQIEVLRMLLKRYLILCSRVYKSKENYPEENNYSDIIREFNYLVQKNFKTKSTVAEYADLLNKSPKTISNTFKKFGSESPLQYIQDRKMLEARRLLCYSNMTIQDIAYEIGFEDIQTFSRFFKRQEGNSPKKFRELSRIG